MNRMLAPVLLLAGVLCILAAFCLDACQMYPAQAQISASSPANSGLALIQHRKAFGPL